MDYKNHKAALSLCNKIDAISSSRDQMINREALKHYEKEQLERTRIMTLDMVAFDEVGLCMLKTTLQDQINRHAEALKLL